MSFNLKERQGLVQSLWNAVNQGGALLDDLPRIVRVLIESESWREREVDGKIIEHKRFLDFLTKPPRGGCGWNPEKVERLISHDPYVLTLWRNAVTPLVGTNQHTDNISTLEGNGDGHGTSRSYTLSRLERDHPELFERVCAGELSANAAAIQAGFRKKLTPFEQIVRLIPKLSVSELADVARRVARQITEDDD
jgi:hypothetical protein